MGNDRLNPIPGPDPNADPEAETSPALPRPRPAPDADALPLHEAQTLVGDRYRLERLVGAGGMGRVFRATDTVLRRTVAIKLQRRPEAAGGAPEAVLAEARAMAGLRHEHVCRILEVVLDAPSPFIVMEWIDGVDLRQHARDLDTDARIDIFRRVVEAVAAAHAAGLVHGDIKPENVLVTAAGEPMLVDFGLARSLEPTASAPSPAGGTPGYAAPEQWSDTPSGPSADVYGLGVMLFELLTDSLPFAGRSAREVCRLAATTDPPLPQDRAPEVPEALQRICLVAIERDPAHRYPDAGALGRDLARAARREAVTARPTFLSSRFGEQVRTVIDRVAEWRRLGLVTPREADETTARLLTMLRPESPWIVDSRRLSAPQVALYLGGWLVLLALSVGLWFSWDSLAAWHRLALSCGAAGAFTAAGLLLNRRGQHRAGLIYLITGTLVTPVAVWVLLRETGALGAEMDGRELVALPGLMNRQILAIAAAWLAASVASRVASAASAFTPFIVLAGVGAWEALWLCLGRFTDSDRLTIAEASVWTGALGAALIPLGLTLNRAEESALSALGPARPRQRDAWPALSAGAALLTLGLAGAAFYAPERYALREVDPEAWFTPTRWQAVAFALNGIALLALTTLLEHRRTPLRARVAGWLRWIIPSHFLGALLALEIDNGFGLWPLWLALLPLGALAAVLLSVPRQWKPFLVTGLAYLAIWYVRAFRRAGEHLDDPTGAYGALLLSLLAVGAIIMLAATRTPRAP